MNFYEDTNTHGRLSKAEYFPILGTRRLRRLRSQRRKIRHIVSNGIHDPITHFHILDALLQTLPGQFFRTRDVVEYLEKRVPEMSWDPRTVGRVIYDMSESMEMKFGWKVIGATRRWDGSWFDITSHPEGRAAMESLLEDLGIMSERLIEQERNREAPVRLNSPLNDCPTLRI